MRVLQVLSATCLIFLCVQASRVKLHSIVNVSAEAQSDAQMLQKGALVLGRFQLIAKVKDWPADIRGFDKISYLGKGAFGETWLAHDQTRNQDVAVKFFYRALKRGVQLLNMRNANPREKAQLSDAGAECDTPAAIIRAKPFPAGQMRFAECYENKVNDPKYAHLVLAVAGTQNLEEYVASHRLSSTDKIRIAKMMLEGLVQMEGSFVHKDIKPANLMVYEDAEDGKLYLRYIDFGLVARDGQHSGVAGTPMFMPPEVWPDVPRNPKIDHKFDLYSAGETLYWLICGQTFHEHIFDGYGSWGEREIARQLKAQSPSKYCTPSSSLAGLFQIVVEGLMPASAADRVDASMLIQQGVFDGVSTMKAPPPEVEKPIVEQKKPVSPIVEPAIRLPEVDEAPQRSQRRTFLDDCHDDKAFWFANANQCCLRETYDRMREEVCRRPCGPNVAYRNGQCANNCDYKGDGRETFSQERQCCVSVVWKTKCIYKDPLPLGEGWKWQHA